MLVTVIVVVFSLAWIVFLAKAFRHIAGTPIFEDLEPNPMTDWPSLSVIITARNEAEHLEGALQSVLAQDYPHLEIILIDDRSTDNTREIMQAMAAKDARIKPIWIDSLPAGWLGKVHAYHQGSKAAQGTWMLFADADVYFEQDVLRHAISVATHEERDHLALIPFFRTRSFWLEVTMSTFCRVATVGCKGADVGRPGKRAFAGVGAFNLVRSEALAKTPGFQWLRMEVVDDIGLGYMLFEHGARSMLAMTRQSLAITWYPTIASMFRGLEKNLFAAAHYQYPRAALMVLLLWILEGGLLALPFFGFGLVTLLIYGLRLAIVIHWSKRLRRGWFSGLFEPFGVVLFSAMLVRTTWLCATRGWIDWRGTRYSLDALRKGQRVKI